MYVNSVNKFNNCQSRRT